MAIDVDLFKSILAMDSYNRGYGASIAGLGGKNAKIGTATIGDDSSVLGAGKDQAASFYGVAYKLLSGETVISYRGTDNIEDVFTGWDGGLGNPDTIQSDLAVKFFQAIAKVITGTTTTGLALKSVDVSFTGHSLGGGLAGLMGALYQKSGVLFDNMAFESAANNAYNFSTRAIAPDTALKKLIYGTNTPWKTSVADPRFLYLKSISVEGEALTYLRNGQITPQQELDIGPNVSLGAVQSHSMALLSILLYAEKAAINTNWLATAKYVLPALYDNAIGLASGAKSISATSVLLTAGDYAGVLRQAIAYSIVNEGTRIFGDTGVKALFNDAADLGKALSPSNLAMSFQNSAEKLTDIFTQYAGQLALGKVLQSVSPKAVDGVLTLPSDGQTLSVDFSENIWSVGRATAKASSVITSRQELTDDLVSRMEGGDVRTGMTWLWNDNTFNAIDKITFSTFNTALTSTLPGRTATSDLTKVTLFVAADTNDNITGSKDRDFISGGVGNDTLRGEANDDLLVGGKGSDQLYGGIGRDFLLGGDGADIIYAGEGNDSVDGGAQFDIIISGGGNDTLLGGAGTDVFNITGIGSVTINDTGKGDFLAINNNVIYGEASKSGTTYSLMGYTLQKVGADLTVTGDVGTITLKNWVEGDYNISLKDAPGVIVLNSPSGTFVFPNNSYGSQQMALNLAYQILGVSTPLVIDLNKNGVELTEIYSSNARFDIDADGFAEQSGWIKPTDGFLVVDKNNNGVIDSQAEMFGADASSTAWAKLKSYDSNNDGKVNASDANWSKMRVWKDLDQDRWTDSGELFTPTAVGVYGFKYAKEAFSQSPSAATANNAIDGRGAWLNSSGGNAGYYYDVLFTTDDRNTVYVGNNLKSQGAVDFNALMSGIQHIGQGNVLPLHQALSGNTALKHALNAFATLPTGTYSNKLDAPIINILKAWANIGSTANEYELKKAIMTVFDGVANSSPGVIQNPWKTAYQTLPRSVEDQFDILMDDMRASFLPQGSYSKFFTNGYYSFADNRFHINDSLEAIIARAKPFQPSDSVEKSFFWSGLSKAILLAKDITVGGVIPLNENVVVNAIKTAAGADVVVATDFGRVGDNESIVYSGDYPYISYYIGSDGNNTIKGADGAVYGNGGNDLLYGKETVSGGAGNDTLYGQGMTATLSGGAGNNYFHGRGGSNAETKYIIGKDVMPVTDIIDNFTTEQSYTGNYEKIDLSALGSNLTINLRVSDFGYGSQFTIGNRTVIIQDFLPNDFSLQHFIGVSRITLPSPVLPSAGNDSITGTVNADIIDSLGGNDTIIGLAGDDSLYGNQGNDLIEGRDGDDILVGGVGSDVLKGGPDADIFDFNTLLESSKTNADIIADFEKYQDFIDVRGLGFTGIDRGAPTGTKLGYTYDAVADDTVITGVSDFKIILEGNLSLGSAHVLF